MNSHIIFQTASFNFFNALKFKSIAWLELIKNDVHFIYLDTAKTIKHSREAIEKINAERWCLGHVLDESNNITFSMLKNEIYAYMDNVVDLKTVSLYNGHPDIYIENEIERYECSYMTAKSLPDMPLFKVIKQPCFTIFWIITLVVIEYCAEHNITVYNIWEDPLQHKFPYIKNLDIRNYYFHYIGDTKPMYYANPTKTGKTCAQYFEFCPSQQYWYMMCQHRDSNLLMQQKTYKFVFAMTDSWAALKERRRIIQAMEYMAEPNFVDKTGILFRYTSNHHKSAYKYNQPMLPYETYMQLLKQSNFTMMVPSYDINCFSLRRFFEAMSNDCIPLILDTCNYEDGFNHNQEFIAIVKQYLLISEKDLCHLDNIIYNKSEQYNVILDKIKSSEYWKTYNNPKLYLKYVKMLYI